MRVYQDPESEDWVAEVTDLPGCIGVGDTEEEAIRTAKAFISEWIEEALTQGWDVPEPTRRVEASGRFVVRLPRSLHARLQELADLEGTSLNQLVVSMLSQETGEQAVLRALDKVASRLRYATAWDQLTSAWEEAMQAQSLVWATELGVSLKQRLRPASAAETQEPYTWIFDRLASHPAEALG